jgi:hypothetical protein
VVSFRDAELVDLAVPAGRARTSVVRRAPL